jgi:hypothetical protein
MFRDMTPSLPPGLSVTARPESETSPLWFGLRHFASHNQFAFVFGLLFIGKVATRLSLHSSNPTQRSVAAWAERLFERVSDNWFGILIGNAFGAFFSALVLHWVQQFSLAQLVWQFLMGLLQPLIQALTSLVPGGGGLFKAIGNLFSWYGDNQLKFNFWLLYSAAICDDLGLPNLKTLGRRLWHSRTSSQTRPTQTQAPS